MQDTPHDDAQDTQPMPLADIPDVGTSTQVTSPGERSNSVLRTLWLGLVELGDVTHLKFPGYYQSLWRHIFFARPGDAIFSLKPKKAWTSKGGKIRQQRVSVDARLGRQTARQLAGIRKVFAACAKKPGADRNKVIVHP